MSKNTEWKDYLLKSGVPLEYEIHELFKKHDFFVRFEHSYLREDENKLENQFSCDLYAEKTGYDENDSPTSTLEVLVECKYRHESVNWIFTPDNYEDHTKKITPYSYLHTNDYFTDRNQYFYYHLFTEEVPACGNGIEITQNGQNPKSINQAISQLNFAMMERLLTGIENQLIYVDQSDSIYFHVPIIVTTANLFRLKEDITINEIKSAKTLEDVASKETSLLLNNPVGEELKAFNIRKVRDFIDRIGQKKLDQKFRDSSVFTVDTWLRYLAEDTPKSILIIQYEPEQKGMNQMFKTFEDMILNPTKEVKKKFSEWFAKAVENKKAMDEEFHSADLKKNKD